MQRGRAKRLLDLPAKKLAVVLGEQNRQVIGMDLGEVRAWMYLDLLSTLA